MSKEQRDKYNTKMDRLKREYYMKKIKGMSNEELMHYRNNVMNPYDIMYTYTDEEIAGQKKAARKKLNKLFGISVASTALLTGGLTYLASINWI